MDRQTCFSPPSLSSPLTNQPNVITGFSRSSFHDISRLIPSVYEMHHQTAAAAAENNDAVSGKEGDVDLASPPSSMLISNNGGNSRTSGSSPQSGTAFISSPEERAAEAGQPAVPPGAVANTRLLREILQQGKKHSDSELDEDNDCDSPASVFVGDEEDSAGEEHGRRSMTKSDGEDGEEVLSGSGGGTAACGGVIRRTGSPVERLTGHGGLRVDSLLLNSAMRVPSNGASSENSESAASTSSSCGDRRKTKRKQVYPQQQVEDVVRVHGMAGPGQEKEVMRKQLSLMQEQIDDLQERYSTVYDATDMRAPLKTNGSPKRKHAGCEVDDRHDIVGSLSLTPSEIQTRLPFIKGVRRINDRLAALISTEIHEKISPIVASVINKYLQEDSPADNGKGHTQSITDVPVHNQRSKVVASPMAVRPASPVALPRKQQPSTERVKQPLIVSNGGGDGQQRMSPKSFPPMYRNFPSHPFFANENKPANDFISMHLAAMAGAAPTMYNPNFHQMMGPSFFPAEQTEPMPLVVSQKKKRHKVTDTRITPRSSMMGKMVGGGGGQNEDSQDGSRKFMQTPPVTMNAMNTMLAFPSNPFLARNLEMHRLNHSDRSPFHPQPGMDVGRFGPTFYANGNHREASSPLGGSAGSPEDNDEVSMDASDLDSTDMSLGGGRPATNFSRADSLTYPLSSTLTPMHLRKAKLMFFFTRYPNSATLKTFFPDIRFNKNNTAQLVKWFSNFREYYYIQMERTAKQLLADGVQQAHEIEVLKDSELYRALNLHYNRNNHIDVPDAFRDVVEETLKEFFRALQCKRDQEPSWKKAIYKIINRMDDPIPDYFKLPHFLEQLE